MYLNSLKETSEGSIFTLIVPNKARKRHQTGPKTQLSWPVAIDLWGEKREGQIESERVREKRGTWAKERQRRGGGCPAESGVPHRAMPGIEKGPFSHIATPNPH